MIGTLINTGAIIVGGVIGLTVGRELSSHTERRIRLILGIATIYLGLKTVWQSVNGPFFSMVGQVMIACLALVLGNLIGKGLRLQATLNRLGEHAKTMFNKQDPAKPARFGEGFVTCTIIFCVGPLAILGPLEDGLTGQYHTLLIKSAMDGLATVAFVKTFGIGAAFAAIPVLAYQGTITLGARALQPFLENQALLDSINTTGGLLILCISVVILGIQKVPLADYLPSLIVAPVLSWLFR